MQTVALVLGGIFLTGVVAVYVLMLWFRQRSDRARALDFVFFKSSDSKKRIERRHGARA